MKSSKLIWPSAILFVFAPLLALTLLSNACRSLDPAGVYNSNQALYEADKAIVDGYDLMHTFVQWEFNNRAALPPQVTQAADAVRANAQKALKSASAARRALAANPTDGTAQSDLQSALSTLQAVLSQVAQYLPKPTS